MEIRFDVPAFIEEALRAIGDDPNQVVKEIVLVELYRKEQIAHHELAEALGLDRYESDGVLKRHGVDDGLTLEGYRAEVESLRRLLDEKKTAKGEDVSRHLRSLVQEGLKQPQALGETLAPIHEDFRRSGLTEEELGDLIEEARDEVRQEKERGKPV